MCVELYANAQSLPAVQMIRCHSMRLILVVVMVRPVGYPCLLLRAFVCVRVYVIKLHITAQSGPVVLVILCHSRRDQ